MTLPVLGSNDYAIKGLSFLGGLKNGLSHNSYCHSHDFLLTAPHSKTNIMPIFFLYVPKKTTPTLFCETVIFILFEVITECGRFIFSYDSHQNRFVCVSQKNDCDIFLGIIHFLPDSKKSWSHSVWNVCLIPKTNE